MNNKKIILIISQICVSVIAYGIVLWKVANTLKNWLMPNPYSGLYTWVYPFYHPYQGALLNYILLCLGMGIVALIVYYMFPGIKQRLLALETIDYSRIYLCWGGMLFFAIASLYSGLAFLGAPLLVLPFLYGADFNFLKRITPVATLLLLIVLCLEPYRVFMGPVRLMNEYPDLFGTTVLFTRAVNNKDFLATISAMDMENMVTVMNLRADLSGLGDNERKRNLLDIAGSEVSSLDNLIAQSHREESQGDKASADSAKGVKTRGAGFLARFQEIRDFYRKNNLEYTHQNMTRGQINHIGHVLNPINEYISGKPIENVFMQYGLGNTLVIKWMMDLFGGASIHNYYKCYAFYICYFVLFLAMLFYVFKDSVYVFASFCGLAAAYFLYSYIAFILAPGLIPTMHFLDVFTAIALMCYLRNNGGTIGVLIMFLLAFAGLLLNRQFGLVLIASLTLSLGVYYCECNSGVNRLLKVLSLACLFVATVVGAMLLSAQSPSGVFKLYLTGFFSWAPSGKLVALTVLYLLVSYSFLIFAKENKSPYKYFYVFVFVYSQGLLAYFYWSGLLNHLPMALPFLALQFFLMLYMVEHEVVPPLRGVVALVSPVKAISALAAFLLMISALNSFYRNNNLGKSVFDSNFANHLNYQWNFDRAKLISTINPAPIEEAVDLISKYSAAGRADIYILSKMDNLLPFLAKKYNRLKHSDLSWYLVDAAARASVVEQLQSEKPEIIFVDSAIRNEFRDAWGVLFNSDWVKPERISRDGRGQGLREVFYAISGDYKLIEKGDIIAVYKRIE